MSNAQLKRRWYLHAISLDLGQRTPEEMVNPCLIYLHTISLVPREHCVVVEQVTAVMARGT